MLTTAAYGLLRNVGDTRLRMCLGQGLEHANIKPGARRLNDYGKTVAGPAFNVRYETAAQPAGSVGFVRVPFLRSATPFRGVAVAHFVRSALLCRTRSYFFSTIGDGFSRIQPATMAWTSLTYRQDCTSFIEIFAALAAAGSFASNSA